MESWRGIMATVLAAVRFLTVVPVPGSTAASFGAAAFPAVGLGIGLAVALADELFGFVPFELRNIAVVVFLTVLTGGIHYDGLADTLDGVGGHDRDERLRLMREGTIGTFAVLGLMLALATKISALTLLGPPTRLYALVLAPMLARLALVLVAWRATPAREDGLGASFCRALEPADLWIAGGTGLLVSLVLGGGIGFLGFLLAAGVAWAVRAAATHVFGGITGDVLGAAAEVVETLLLAFYAMARLGA